MKEIKGGKRGGEEGSQVGIKAGWRATCRPDVKTPGHIQFVSRDF